ncbi:MAG: hypothetical protein CL829_01210 [Crocinitomicaceae bacterium]|nr:hypothetical protein [Crocinitomicaceae bacterium]
MTRRPTWAFFLSLSALLVGCVLPPRQDEGNLAVALYSGWTLHPAAPQQEESNGRDAILAEVPGRVLSDLVRAQRVPPPYEGTHERDVQWVEDSTWWYQTFFDLPSEWSAVGHGHLTMDGLDTYATVSVNGQEVLRADNAHRTWTSDGFKLRPHGNRLVVRFDPVAQRGLAAMQAFGMALPASNEDRPIGQQTSPFTRKPGYQFGWDWGPRLAGPGITGPVWLHPGHGRRLDPTAAMPWLEVLSMDTDVAKLLAHGHKGWSLTWSENDIQHQVQWHEDTLSIDQPKAWWPRHTGEQPLYEALWTHQETGKTHRHTVGLRTLEWRKEPDDFGTSFQVEVNGTPIHARGANVVPPDFLEAHDVEGWLRLVELAKEAHMNMIRVWGGGVYPPDAFYDACDREGILVWQDFMFACAMVPNDKAFIENVRQEAKEQVLRLRAHPCLALWCGNNEVAKAWRDWGWQDLYDLHGKDSARVELAASHLFKEVLPEIVQEASDVDYWASSPSLPDSSGDVHAWGVWFGLADWDHYSEHGGRFASEYGLQSLPNLHTLREAGILALDDEALQFRQRSRMDWLEPGFDGWDMMAHFMAKTVGIPEAGNLEDWITRSQMTQAEGIRQALERHRASLGRYAGSLYWSLNDVWPAVSWSSVDHAGRWKLAHHAARRANAPRAVIWDRTREDSLQFMVFNDLQGSANGMLTVNCCSIEGDVMKRDSIYVDLAGRSSGTFSFGEASSWRPKPTTSYLSWSWHIPDNPCKGSSLWTSVASAELGSPTLEISATDSSLAMTADTYVPAVHLVANVPGHFSDNGMPLLPGAMTTVGFVPESPSHDTDLQFEVRLGQ